MKKLLLALLLLLVTAVAVVGLGLVLSLSGTRLGAPTVLVWRVEGPILEQAPPPLLPFLGYEPPLSLAEIYRALRAARGDDRVLGLAVYIQDPSFGLAKAQELRRQLGLLQEAGKFVDCYLEAAGEGGNGTLAYYLATACDEIRLAPAADFNLLGLYAQGLFLRGSLEKLHVEPDFLAVGAYKSAVEAYTRREWSPAAEEAVGALLDRDFELLADAVAQRLGSNVDEVRTLIDGAPYSAQEALDRGLVDALAYPDELQDRITERVGEEPVLLSLREYRPRRRRGERIAVVFAQGTIVRGESGTAPWTDEIYLGSDDMAAILRSLAEDDSVAAVVLRVDSPGGSSLASDLILREVTLLAEVKPVVASLSDVAASGGYYIATKATAIVAEEATVTGSIGVYGGKLVTRGLEEDHLGLTRDSLKRGANADIYSSHAPFSPEQARRIEALMRRVYDTFIDHVADGRGLSRDEVAAVAEGRVWAGVDALRLGLVDEIGGLDRALELAADAAGIDSGTPLQLDFHPRRRDLLDWLVRRGEPLLPVELARLRHRLGTEGRRVLELPPEMTSLVQPF